MLCVLLIVLTIFGILYSLKYLMKPATYGIGKDDSKSDKEEVSIFVVLACSVLVIALGAIG